MLSISKFTGMLLLLSWSYSQAIAQDTLQANSTIYSSLSARKYKIALTNNKRLIAISLDSMRRNILYYSGKNGSKNEVSTELLKAIKIAKKKKPVARGLLIGALGGATSGALIGIVTYKEPEPDSWSIDFGPGLTAGAGAVIGLLGGALSGTIIGAASNRYILYDFSTIPPAEKHDQMRRILSGQ